MTVTTPATSLHADVAATLDRVEQALDKDRLPVGIFNDEAVFKAEMDQIFGTC
jgi:hypothetical protein